MGKRWWVMESLSRSSLRVLNIKFLSLADSSGITNDGVSLLCNMPVLEELDLKDCIQLTDVGGQAISAIPTLKKLNLARVTSLTEKTIVALAKNRIKLEVLNLSGGVKVTTVSIDAFLGHKCLQSLNLVDCLSDDFRESALERLDLGCPSLTSIVVEENSTELWLREWEETTAVIFAHRSRQYIA